MAYVEGLAPLSSMSPLGTIAPSPHQPPATEFELTHDRPMPLPFAIDFVMNGKKHACLYAGHGQSKTVFRLTDEPKVLKLTLTVDHVPYASRLLAMRCSAEQPAVKMCPRVHAIGRCDEQDQCGNPIRQWFAWLAETATPLDKYIQQMNADRKGCIKIALYKQIVAAQHGLLLSDNNLFNFGVVDNTVVIIDLGSRPLQPHALAKSFVNDKGMRKWWKKLEWQCVEKSDWEECQYMWTRPGATLDGVARQLCEVQLPPTTFFEATSVKRRRLL